MAAELFVVAKRATPKEIATFFRKDLRRIVNVHAVMFRKLLAEEEQLPMELAMLFEDAGNRYLDIAEEIMALHNGCQGSEVE